MKHSSRKTRVVVRLLMVLAVLLPLCISYRDGSAQSGVLIPSTSSKPDAATLSLQVMNVDVLIDNQHARVRVMQIFDSHSSQILEGKYLFALPQTASIFDFAVWDADVRIPGVMMEKRRANKVYSEIKQQQVDPGLLQQDDEHEGRSAFSAKVFPIPAYGTKRIEIEYTEVLPVDGLASHFTFPLKPSFGDPQRVEEFNLHLHVLNDYPIAPINEDKRAYPLAVTKSEPTEFEADFHASGLELKDDFSFDYRINVPESTLSFTTYRAPEQISAYDLRDPALAAQNPNGYFEARAIFNQNSGTNAANKQPRNVILLLDTSLSMYGEKLKRAVEALDYFLNSLSPQDHFDLVLFNEETYAFSPAPLPATPDNVERALAFIRNSMLGSGSDVRKVLEKAAELSSQFPQGERSIVLVSDANPTLGTRDLKQILKTLPPNNGVNSTRVFAFGLGSDANGTLLEELAKTGHGYSARARETEDITTALKIFFDHVGSTSIENSRLASNDTSNLYQVYATGDYSFDGSSLAFVGRYRKPSPQATITVTGQFGTETIRLSRDVVLPELADIHSHLPRVWARARVEALLREMDLNGEREDYISEIIRLSQKYRFVTPYTAFIAAPRALLRPRLIQPGDPVLRVKTDESINSVFAVFPFGETLPLKFLQSEGVWEVRFLAPAWLPDGTYRCRLLMTDKNGNGYQETKSFVIDSHAPKLGVKIDDKPVRAGDELIVKVSADSDTVRLFARMYGAQPVRLSWSNQDQTNVGKLRVPANLAAGRYVLTVSAEDAAHNQSTAEVPIEVISR
ncbi:MAG TPA: VIT domain-containing protein [Pyrinomonadaceae bacterium]|nr:VIT domain-containing protein [Pyrinomonadaceae bacterium]